MKTQNFIEQAETLIRDHDGANAHTFLVSNGGGYIVYAVFGGGEIKTYIQTYKETAYIEEARVAYDNAINKIIASGFTR